MMEKVEALAALEKIGMEARGETTDVVVDVAIPAVTLTFPVYYFHPVRQGTAGNSPSQRGAFAEHRRQRREKRGRRR